MPAATGMLSAGRGSRFHEATKPSKVTASKINTSGKKQQLERGGMVSRPSDTGHTCPPGVLTQFTRHSLLVGGQGPRNQDAWGGGPPCPPLPAHCARPRKAPPRLNGSCTHPSVSLMNGLHKQFLFTVSYQYFLQIEDGSLELSQVRFHPTSHHFPESQAQVPPHHQYPRVALIKPLLEMQDF